ncbi:DNA polymerase III subunit chi [Acinetobacter gerneri]
MIHLLEYQNIYELDQILWTVNTKSFLPHDLGFASV